MSLVVGSRLGVYEITAPIGEGGMGQVFRATDTRLKRQVAIKILPPSLADDADRLARFQREAEVLASLNHPNIAAIYGLEEVAGLTALVMELVEGDDLSQRIARGTIPLEDALPIAKQIADALEAAHDQHIIHRDLKPANIKLRADGTVKVLDFGLAKALDAGSGGVGGPGGLSMSPTITTPAMTQAGMILGTAAYMAPEQAKGRAVDRRADIWAFGAVLYEMLTASRPFAGEDVSDTLANVLKMDPDWARLPAEVPARVRQLIRACLQKNPKQRIGDMQDVRLALDGAFESPAPVVSAPTPASSRRREYLWAAAALVFIVTTAALGLRIFVTPAPRAATVRFEIVPPAGARMDVTSMAFSPDGRTLAFAAAFESKTQLWVRALDASTAQPIPGTDEASRPFWSPDSHDIAFFAQGKLKKIAATGGATQTLCSLSSTGTYNGSWGASGVILFAANDQGPLFRVPAGGGQPIPASQLDASLKEARHSYPDFLPDGRHYLFVAFPSRTGQVGTLDSSERKPLPGVTSEAKYSPTGYLLFLQNRALVAQRFDTARLTLSGDARQIGELSTGPLLDASASLDGIAYINNRIADSQLVWFGRDGKQLSIAGPVGEYEHPALSPDGRFVAFDRGTPADVWVLDIQKRLASRFTSNAAADMCPVWSPDGQMIVFTSDRDGAQSLYERAFGVMGDEKLLLKNARTTVPMDWARDGRYIAYDTGLDVWALPRSGDREPIRVTATAAAEIQASLSPDGRWIAYASTESGRYEVHVQSFPQSGLKQQVSIAGGQAPRWKSDGHELYYVAPDGMLMAVPIKSVGSSLELSTPSPLFQTGLTLINAVDATARAPYDVAADGRFLMAVPSSDQAAHITVILNWSSTR